MVLNFLQTTQNLNVFIYFIYFILFIYFLKEKAIAKVFQ